MKRRGTPASSPSKFSRCSITHFQKDSWYVCEGGYCSRRGLRRIEDSTKSCTWRNGSWEGNDKNRGCFRAEYACKRLNKAESEDGINSIKVLLHIADADAYQPALNRSRAHTRPFAFRGGVAKTTSCSAVTVSSYASAQGLKYCGPSRLLRVWISPLKQGKKMRSKAKATGLFQGTHRGVSGRKRSASNLRNPTGHVIGLETK